MFVKENPERKNIHICCQKKIQSMKLNLKVIMIENTTLLAGSFGLAMYGKSHTGYFIKGRILHEILPILVPHSQHFVQLLV